MRAYSESIQAFKDPSLLASGMTPAKDLLDHPEMEKKMQEFSIPQCTNPAYTAFSEWHGRVKTSYLSRTTKPSSADPLDDI